VLICDWHFLGRFIDSSAATAAPASVFGLLGVFARSGGQEVLRQRREIGPNAFAASDPIRNRRSALFPSLRNVSSRPCTMSSTFRRPPTAALGLHMRLALVVLLPLVVLALPPLPLSPRAASPPIQTLIEKAIENVANQDFAAAVPRFHQVTVLTANEPLSPENYLSSQNTNQLFTHACSHGMDATYEPDAWCITRASRSASLHFAGVANSAICSKSKCGIWDLDYDESRHILIEGLRKTVALLVELSGIIDDCQDNRLGDPALWRKANPKILAASELRWRGDVDVEQNLLAVQEEADKHVTAAARSIREKWGSFTFQVSWTEPQLRALRAAQRACDAMVLAKQSNEGHQKAATEMSEARSLLHRLFQNMELAFSFNTIYSDVPSSFLPVLARLLNAPWPSEPADSYGSSSEDLSHLHYLGGRAPFVPLGSNVATQLQAGAPARTRISIFSPDLRRHPVGFSIQGMLPAFREAINRVGAHSNLPFGELVCFATGPHDARLKNVFEPIQLQQARKLGLAVPPYQGPPLLTTSIPASESLSLAQRVWAELHGWRELANIELNGTAASRNFSLYGGIGTDNLLSQQGLTDTAYLRVGDHPYPQMGLGERLQAYMHPQSHYLEKACDRYTFLNDAVAGLKTGAEEGLLLSVMRYGPRSDGNIYSPEDIKANLAAGRSFLPFSHVLLDLAGLTAGGRPNVMARRVAPIQIHYMGSPVPPPIPYATDWYVADAVALAPESIHKTSPVLVQGRRGKSLDSVANKAYRRWSKSLSDADTALEVAQALANGKSFSSFEAASTGGNAIGGEEPSVKAQQGVIYLPSPYHCSTLFIPTSVLATRPSPKQRWQDVQESSKRLLTALHSLAEEEEIQRPGASLPLPQRGLPMMHSFSLAIALLPSPLAHRASLPSRWPTTVTSYHNARRETSGLLPH
jgi:hypothetical protein